MCIRDRLQSHQVHPTMLTMQYETKKNTNTHKHSPTDNKRLSQPGTTHVYLCALWQLPFIICFYSTSLFWQISAGISNKNMKRMRKTMQLTGEKFHEWNSHGDGGVNLWELQQQRRQLPHHCNAHLIRADVQSSNTCTRTLGHQTKFQRVHKLRLEIKIISLLLLSVLFKMNWLQLLNHKDTKRAIYPVR